MDEMEVSVYIDSIIVPYCEIDINHCYCNRHLEIISINVNKPGLKYMFVSAIYRPPRENIKGCIDRLQEIFSTIQNSKKKFWLLGDFNVDFLDRNLSNRNRFIELFKKFGCKQLITDVTRPGKHKSSCLDWIITNCSFVSDVCSLYIMIADRFAVGAFLT